ncbi:MAG TPA: hypothetical protein VHZ55_17200 [Bryobacteraceae bacterium]|nr:hypothetical protein [Bryobacteraceae bacterium]
MTWFHEGDLCGFGAVFEYSSVFSPDCRGIRPLLTRDAQLSPRYCFQTLRGDFLFALQTGAIPSVIDAANCRTKPPNERGFTVEYLHSYISLDRLLGHINRVGDLLYTNRVARHASGARFFDVQNLS